MQQQAPSVWSIDEKLYKKKPKIMWSNESLVLGYSYF